MGFGNNSPLGKSPSNTGLSGTPSGNFGNAYFSPTPMSAGPVAPTGALYGPPYSQYAADQQSYLDFQNGLNAPTFAGIDAQNAAAMGRLGAINGATGASNAAAKQQADIRRQQLDNQIGMNQIDINAIPRQIGYNDAVYGVNGQQYNSTDQMLQQLYGLTEADFLNQQARADLAYRQSRREWGNDVAARGSRTAPETAARYRDFDTQHILDVDAARNTKTGAQATLTNQRNQALYDYTLQGLSKTEANAKLKDRGDQLALQAKNYGLDKDALLAGINAQLAQNNLQGILSAGQVLDGVNSNNAQKAQLMNEIIYGSVAYANGQGHTGTSLPRTPSAGLQPIG